MSTPPTPQEVNPNPIDAGVTIGHVHLKSGDLSLAEKFYVDILGFSIMARYPNALFVAAGTYHHHLAFNTWTSEHGQPAPADATGLYHIAIKYPTRLALADALRRLTEAGHVIDGISDHGTQEALYLRDLESKGVELYWDRPQSEWPLDTNGHIIFKNAFFSLDNLLGELSKA